jgi:hypothetical protein
MLTAEEMDLEDAELAKWPFDDTNIVMGTGIVGINFA